VSRYQPQPFDTKHALLMSASISMVGGNAGLWALRMPLEHLGAVVYPQMFSLAQAHESLRLGRRHRRRVAAGAVRDHVAAFLDWSRRPPTIRAPSSGGSSSPNEKDLVNAARARALARRNRTDVGSVDRPGEARPPDPAIYPICAVYPLYGLFRR
jgi:hypothetical protein